MVESIVMYTKEQASHIRQQFWTRFGKYMAPVLSSEGEKVNWVNYRTGIPGLYFRMNVTKDEASVSIEIMHKDEESATNIYRQFELLKPMLETYSGKEWEWHALWENEYGQLLSKVEIKAGPVNIFKEADWPEIISFLKPQMIALDAFWNEYKMVFETIV